jgi:hypothetical protein
MKFRPALALLSLTLTTSLFAADAPMPKPAPELKQLAFFIGTWQCKGTQTFGGPTMHYTGTVTNTWALGGYWLDVHVRQAKSKENPMPLSGNAYLGYDPADKKFEIFWVDNTGGFETAEFTGWEGDKLEWTGIAHMGTMTAKGRDIFIKSGKNKLTHKGEMEQAGKWVEVMNETCTK